MFSYVQLIVRISEPPHCFSITSERVQLLSPTIKASCAATCFASGFEVPTPVPLTTPPTREDLRWKTWTDQHKSLTLALHSPYGLVTLTRR